MSKAAHAGRIALAILLAGCGAKPRAVAIDIKGIAFNPATVQVQKGDTLVFTNHDFLPHTATARDQSWDSGSLAPNASYRTVVQKSGEYYCRFHPNMVGRITVR